MGLIKGLTDFVSPRLKDQLKEFVTCSPIDRNVSIHRENLGKRNKNPSATVVSFYHGKKVEYVL